MRLRWTKIAVGRGEMDLPGYVFLCVAVELVHSPGYVVLLVIGVLSDRVLLLVPRIRVRVKMRARPLT